MVSEYQVLDVTCGGKMAWSDKDYSSAVYMDRRIRPKGFREVRPNWETMPDFVGDFTEIPLADESINLVFFDPPHVINNSESEDSWVTACYGSLMLETWKKVLLDALIECWRVVRPGGSLIFKWSDVDRSAEKVLSMFPHAPLFGSRIGKNNNTIWYCFYKTAPLV